MTVENGVERGLGPLKHLLTHKPESGHGQGLKATSLSPLSPPSSLHLWFGAAMRGDLWPIVIYVVVGSGVRDVGRWRGEDGSEA